jgi:hypothetical protein
MNAWLLLRRLRGPAYLILFGVTALLNQWGILGFDRSWPLYLILAGVMGLAERALLVLAPPPAPGYYPGYYAGTAVPPYTVPAGESAPMPGPVAGNDPFADPGRRP